jgi:diphthamide biosynthesis protein 2
MMHPQEFLRPIVTPFELEIALDLVPAWDGRYILDFDKVLDEANAFVPEGNTLENGEPEFSLITGKYRQAKRYGDHDSAGNNEMDQALVPRNQDGTVAKVLESASGEPSHFFSYLSH